MYKECLMCQILVGIIDDAWQKFPFRIEEIALAL